MAFVRRILTGVILVTCCTPLARADRISDAKEHWERATGAYALGKFAEAAREYEAAFELKPDPALLYNAAQANRLSGEKKRALLLYQNYLRIYGNRVDNHDEVRRHIEALQVAIETETRAATSPPVSPAPLGSVHGAKPDESRAVKPDESRAANPDKATKPDKAVKPDESRAANPDNKEKPDESRAAKPATSPVLVVAAPAPRPLVKRGWFWGVMVGAAVVVAGVAVGAALGTAPRDPSPSLGHAVGN
jgi:tetratricopeptide (TPR) repeat protein